MAYIQQAHCLTALGNEAETCRALLEGKIGLKRCLVPDVDSDDAVPLAWMPDAVSSSGEGPRWLGHLEALRDLLPDRAWGSAEYPVFLTGSNYGIDHLFRFSRHRDPALLRWMTPHTLAENLQSIFGWGNHVTILSHACVTGQLGLLLAERAVERGGAKEALVFSFDFLSSFVIGGFHSLKILNEGMPAPFQRNAIGSIGLGEGAGVVVVGSEPSAFRIRAQSVFNEMYHFTANAPDGSGFDRVLDPLVKAVTEEGGRVWVKGHGTGTLEAGKLEAEAIARHLPGAPLVSWKGSLGHTLGSCAVVELCVALEAISRGNIPGTPGVTGPFFSKAVCAAPLNPRDFSGVILSSNAFGGAHAAMWIDYE